jgi:PTS system nitrogen regulatory IIA component
MLLSVRDLSAILQVTEETVYRWARDKDLPAKEINGHYRAHPVDLLQWLATHPVKVNPLALPTDDPSGSVPSLEAAIRDGGVYHDLPGATREDALAALAERLPRVEGLPVEDLRLLLTRRVSAGTAFLKDGIAIPHPQYPVIHSTVTPMLAVAFPAAPLPYNGTPIRAGFVLISPTVRSHLRLIGRVIFALHDPRFKELIDRKAMTVELLAAARDLDHVATNGHTAPEVARR